MATKTTKYSEEDLIASLKRNQRDAFEYLYDNYSSALFGSVCRYIPDEEKAADLLQDIFLKIWKNIGKYDSSKGRLFTWMMNITRNTCIDLLRKEKGKYHVDVQDNIIQVDAKTHHQPNISIIDLRGILEKLRPERKVLLDLVYLQGYTQEEAAEQLAIPLGTAKSRIRVALKELKIYFEV
ncbi:MAG: RNA polymerase sigma factor (sigma-70 family) [Spirosomataceae bacterium]